MDNVKKIIIAVIIVVIALVVFFYAPIVSCGILGPLRYDENGQYLGPSESTTIYLTPYELYIENGGFCPT